jgi:hypothetical protein
MSDEIRKDRLEEFFRTHLEHFEEDPGEALFADIAANIPPKPSTWEKIRAWLLPSLLVALLLALLFSGLQYFNVKHLSSQVDEQTQEIEGLKKQLESIEETTNSSITTNEVEEESITTQNNKAISAGNINSSAILNQKATKTKTNFTTQKAGNQPPKKVLNFIENQTSNNLQIVADENDPATTTNFDEENTVEEISNNPSSSEQNQEGQELNSDAFLGPLNLIQSLKMALLDSKLEEEKVKAFDAAVENYPHFYYMLYFEPMLLKGVESSGFQALDSTTTTGYAVNYGLLGGLQFSEHWSVQTGLGFRNISAGLNDFQQSFNYTLRNSVTDDNGFVTSEFIVNESGPKDITLKLTNQIQNDGKDVEGGTPFQVSLNVPYALRYYHVPLWVRYHYNKKKLHLTAKVGVVYHALMGDRYGKIDVRISGDHPSINRLKYNDININIPSTQNNFLEIGAGLGVQYELSSKLFIGVDPTYYRSLNPVFEKKTWGLGLHTNISYRFN